MLLLHNYLHVWFCILHLLCVFILIKRENTIILLDRTSIGHCPLVRPHHVHVPCMNVKHGAQGFWCLEDDLTTSGYKH